jgi:phage shock protein C
MLKRNRDNAMLLGVCSGIADHFQVDPLIVRMAFFAAFWFLGIGLFAYVILAILMS